MKEERFALDNNDLILDMEDKISDKLYLSPEDVCGLLNEQNRRISLLERALSNTIEEFDLYWWLKYAVEENMTLKDYILSMAEKELDDENKR